MANDDLAYLTGVLNGPASSATPQDGTGSSTSGNSSTQHPSAPTATQANGQKIDFASLQPVLEALKISASSDQDLENLSEESVTALLARLEEANLVTDGLEDRLDQLLGDLDGMLESLEGSIAGQVEQEIEQTVEDASKDAQADSTVTQDGQLVNH